MMFQKIGRWMGLRAIDESTIEDTLTLVPVPSPWNRKLRRGFNPSAVMAKEIGATLGRPVVTSLRVSPGVRQARLSRAQRSRNLGRRLQVVRRPSEDVLLIDDVVTTGATAEACAKALRQAGAKRVSLYVPCVTLLRRKQTSYLPD